MLKKLFYSTVSLFCLTKGYEAYTQTYIFTRIQRTVLCGLKILYCYKISFDQNNYLDIHEYIAEDIYNTCIENDGLYVKFGQGIATMDHLLPPPFYKHMSKLQDKAKSTPFEKISRVFEQETGLPIHECFAEFEQKPVASASLAQVHKAKLKNGRQVAVKIQKPHIKGQFNSDMKMHYLINFVLQNAFDLPLLHFVDDIQQNLKKQLDFRIQADNSKKAEINFRRLKRKQLHVPQIIDEFTRQRVMVSQWIDGIKITDDESLKKLGYNKKNIMTHLVRAFADQIFITGFIHCDPHPGNIFVRPHPDNSRNYQIVILDHGLCLEVSNKFRKNYAIFWKSMFLQNNDQMKRICKEWGMNFSEAFAGAQLMRPYSSKKLLTDKIQKEDIVKLQLELKGKVKQLMKQTQNFPKQLLFISRNMNLVRSLNKYYGGIADRITIMAKSAYVGSEIENLQKPKTGFSYQISEIRFYMRIYALQFTNWVLKTLYGKFVDDYIEDESVKNSQQMFKKYGFKPMDEKTYNG